MVFFYVIVQQMQMMDSTCLIYEVLFI